MLPVLFAEAVQYIFGILMFLSALFLILLVLVQRGRGGGLAGALGGMGGQSAFGTKAGDMFTKVTIFAASFWIVLCMLAVLMLGGQSGKLGKTTGGESGNLEESMTSSEPDRTLPGTLEGTDSGGDGREGNGSNEAARDRGGAGVEPDNPASGEP